MTDRRHDASQSMPIWTCNQARDVLGAWSLGALDHDEMAAVDRHLSTCDACRAEADGYRSTASMLSLSISLDPVTPSAVAKRSLMERIADDQLSSAGIAPTTAPKTQAPVDTPPVGLNHPRRRVVWSQAIIAPLAIALVVMTLWTIQLRQQAVDTEEPGGPSDVSEVVMPEGIQSFMMKSECETCQAVGTLLANPEQANALMVAWDLDPSHLHQVWCEESDGSQAMVAKLEISGSGDVMQPLEFELPISFYSRIYVVNDMGEIVEVYMKDSDDTDPAPPSPVAVG